MVQSHVLQVIVGVMGSATFGVIVGSLIAIYKLKKKTENVKKRREEIEIARSSQTRDSGMMVAHR
jgi:hypothetical protein